MNTATKFASAGGVLLAGSLAFGQAAFAAPVACSTIVTMQDWFDNSTVSGGEGCQDQDKIYDYLGDSGNFPLDGINVSIDFFNSAQGERHRITLEPVDAPFQTPGVYTFDYTIAIDLALTPNRYFVLGALDSDVPGTDPDVLVEKDIYDGDRNGGGVLLTSLSTIGGGPDGPNGFPGKPQKLWVYETVAVDQGNAEGNGAIFGVTNTFTQNTPGVPEPMSAALFGLGLLGLGAARRRRAA